MFTVIIPTHNRPHLLHRALQSLINQTWQDFRVIVVSDSGDYLPPLVDFSQLGHRYIYVQRHDTTGQGPAVSRNMGLKLITTPYVIFLDDDDMFEPTHLENLAQFISQHPDADVFFTNFKIIREDRRQNPPQQLEILPTYEIGALTADYVFILNRIPNNCLIYRFDAIRDLQFPPEMELYEDWDFLLKALTGRELTHIPVDSVIIFKSIAEGEVNMRRGNSQLEKTLEATLDIFKRHPAHNQAVAEGRRELLAQAGVEYRE